MKTIFRNLSLLNILLFLVAVFFTGYALSPFVGKSSEFVLPSPKKIVPEEGPKSSNLTPPSSSDYIKIADDNLFHPQRKILADKTADDQTSTPRPDLILYGTLITDTLKVAYIEDLNTPRSSPGRGKRQTALKIGETIGGFTLKEVDPDRVVLAKADDKMTVIVHDPKDKARRAAPAAASPASVRPGAPTQRPALSPQIPPAKRPSVESLVKPQPAPKTRARMTQADERAGGVFRRPPP